MRRPGRWFLRIGAGLALVIVLALYFKRPHTPPIQNADGHVTPDAIASLEQVKIGGVDQWILIRGRNRANPILLFLHGGPGMPAMYLAHAFQAQLENDFVVVQWDRRGAGKSYSGMVPQDSLTVLQLISDTRELVLMLRDRFHQQRVYLVGHSWGSYLGMLVIQRYPELFHAYVGIGQLGDTRELRTLQDEFIRHRARETGRLEAIRELETGGGSAREKWLFEFGAEVRGMRNWWPLVWIGLQSPEYSLRDIFRMMEGLKLYASHMKYDAITGELPDAVASVQVPVYFFTGRYDYTDPFELTQRYFDKLEAPSKKMVWFDHSAHFPFLEQPDQFAAEMRQVLAETR